MEGLTKFGVTTVVGCLGTDGIGRDMCALVAKTKGLNEQGISAYCYTGSYQGNEGFLAIENEVNATLEADKSVIAPGGSAIYGKEAMEHFKEIGTIVYLKLSYEDLAKRLGNLKGRGVVLKEGQTLKDLYDERSKLYEQYAEITVDESGRDIQGTILALREQIGM